MTLYKSERNGPIDPGPGALRPYRILDLTAGAAGFCAKILADLGADVVKVEPPGGHPGRRQGLVAAGLSDGLDWLAFAANCRSVELDLAAERDRFLALVRAADFLVEAFPPGQLDALGLGWDDLARVNPRLVMTSISPFGTDGPYAHWRGPDLVVQALGGIVQHLGDADRPPVRIPGDQGWRQAAASAAAGTLVAHAARIRTGRGQRVDVSAQVAAFWTLLSETGLPELQRVFPQRDGVHARSGAFRRRTIYRCRDGFVAAVIGGGAIGGAMLISLTAWMAEEGMAPAFMRDRDWAKWDTAHLMADRVRGQAEIDATVDAVAAFFAGKSRAELYDGALARGLLLAPVAEIPDILDDVQLTAREFWVDVDGVRHPGPFARLSRTPIALPRPAPRAGEHTAGVVREWSAARPAATVTAVDDAPPFRGLRVLDFTWVVTGPLTGRLLAEHGADVIRVETSRRPDPGRTLPPWADARPGLDRSQTFANYNAGKRSLALDVTRPEGRDIARRLAAHADVVIESFTPGTMDRLGLGYHELSAIRPDLIYVSTCQQGQTGPRAGFRGYGSLAAGLAGFYAMTGWPDREPAMIYGAYTDFTAHHMTSSALLAALDHRRRTGEGQWIDVSQMEASLHFLAPEILAFTMAGESMGRRGNAAPGMAPHGVYPCAGEDRWCAIACETDRQWRALAGIIAAPWCARPDLATVEGRAAAADEIDGLLGDWTRDQEPFALMRRLQAAGVAAGVVQSCAELHRDPQIVARKALALREHPEMGRVPYEAWPFRCPTAAATPGRAPLLGEHTDAVLRELLGASADEIAALREKGVLV